MTEFSTLKYGILPGDEVTEKLASLFCEAAKCDGKKVITFQKGTYYIDSEKAKKHTLFITNTAGDNEYKKGEKPHVQTVAFYMEKLTDAVVDGGDSIFIVDGKMTNAALVECKNVTVKNLEIRHAHPEMHEMLVLSKTSKSVDFQLDSDTFYKLRGGVLYFYGKDFCTRACKNSAWSWWNGLIREATPDKVKRGFSPFHNKLMIKDLGGRKIRVYYTNTDRFEVGDRYYPYDVRRQFAGFFLDRCENIRLENIKQRFNYSLALVCQDCENVTLTKSTFAPEPGSVRKLASVADFCQFCMCRGHIEVSDNFFDGAGDDLLNIHGIHFLIKSKVGNSLKVAFMHSQTHGFNPLRAGDTAASIDADSMLEKAQAKILKSKLINENEIELELSTADGFEKGDVIEDVSACASLSFRNNESTRIITRGLLITTRGKVVVENNLFKSTTMSGILLSDDANDWYESGMCKDVTIKDNTFLYCGETPVRILPENKVHKGFVHENIKIIGNSFKSYESPCITAKSTGGLIVEGNEFLKENDVEVADSSIVVIK